MIVREPDKERRLLAAALSVAYIVLAVAALGYATDLGFLDAIVLRLVGGSLPFIGIGIVLAAWKWPDPLLRPWSAAWRALRSR